MRCWAAPVQVGGSPGWLCGGRGAMSGRAASGNHSLTRPTAPVLAPPVDNVLTRSNARAGPLLKVGQQGLRVRTLLSQAGLVGLGGLAVQAVRIAPYGGP